MAKIDLSKMSLKHLKDHLQEVEEAIRVAEITQRKETLAKIEEVAREAGFTVSELFGAKASGGGGSKKAGEKSPTHRDPENPENVYYGRGPRPRWLKAKLEDGHLLEEFKV